MARLPRPCREADLLRLAADGGIRRAAIVVDVVNDDVDAALDRWLRMLPGVHLYLCAYSWNRARVTAFVENCHGRAGLSVEAGDWPLDQSVMAAVQANCWATCAAYDASGVFVKREIEAHLLPVVQRSGAVFMAHDPSYGIVRVLQARDLRRRLVGRRRRLLIYRAVCRAAFGLAWVAARLPRRRPGGNHTLRSRDVP